MAFAGAGGGAGAGASPEAHPVAGLMDPVYVAQMRLRMFGAWFGGTSVGGTL